MKYIEKNVWALREVLLFVVLYVPLRGVEKNTSTRCSLEDSRKGNGERLQRFPVPLSRVSPLRACTLTLHSPNPLSENDPDTPPTRRAEGKLVGGGGRPYFFCRETKTTPRGLTRTDALRASVLGLTLAWPHRRRGLASDGVRYADARSSCRPPVSKRYETNY